MSLAGRDANGGELRGEPPWLSASCATPCACYPITARPRSLFSVLAAFVAAWMLFWEISTASVDVHFDASEAVVWAQHFAFGYKHPPLTGWLFALWFAVFPRQQWAINLLTVMTSAVALAVSWRLFRDHLDKNRALLGLFALMLIPLYDVKAEVLNANTVMIPVWAAALLFYLARAPRAGHRAMPSWLARSQASRCSANTRPPFCSPAWRSLLWWGRACDAFGVRLRLISWPLGAAIVLAPHVWWMLTQSGASVQFAESVAQSMPFSAALVKSANYFVGSVAYIIGPLIFFAALRPSRAALADTVWPTEELQTASVDLAAAAARAAGAG